MLASFFAPAAETAGAISLDSFRSVCLAIQSLVKPESFRTHGRPSAACGSSRTCAAICEIGAFAATGATFITPRLLFSFVVLEASFSTYPPYLNLLPHYGTLNYPADLDSVRSAFMAYRSIKPWSEIFEPDPLRALLLECGVSAPEAVAETGWHPFRTPEDWWTIVLGTGYRFAVDALSPPNRERVRVALTDGVRRADIRQIRADVVYATARRLA